ncbi:hypothetical protein JTE90_002522 [Oedothorax gibbosus]|uniref:Uncharacterized protein n=1 Tax=Oedothorax gibbosus TaxID=931172 RepID=A0AAV6TL56_9ARAC|nr:hypothetical protein JTE90_002522 [Oedothorax gibbosus]
MNWTAKRQQPLTGLSNCLRNKLVLHSAARLLVVAESNGVRASPTSFTLTDRLEWSRGTPSRGRLLSGERVQWRLRQPNVVHTNGPVGMESRNPVTGPTPKW